MINAVRRGPGVTVVAVFADIGGLNVSQSFACRLNAIVAARAIPGDSDVIKIGGSPRDS